MKVITSKELQTKRAAILKEVQAGQEYQVTFHRKPIAKILPISNPKKNKPHRGTYEGVVESLKYSINSKGDTKNLSHKQLRSRMMADKFDDK